MRIDIVTLFPGMLTGYLSESILRRAQERDLVEIPIHDLRQFGIGKHRITDATPFGGGGGMVLKPEPIQAALDYIVETGNESGQESTAPYVILMSPQGRPLTQAIAHELSQKPWLALICGRYEGVDERIRKHAVDLELSAGDFVLTGGELPALMVVDAVTRLLPGVLGDNQATRNDSFSNNLLEGPHYTRPAVFQGREVPDVLRLGHNDRIAEWRRQQALERTWKRRPELLLLANLSEADKWYLGQLARQVTSGG